MLGVIWNFTSFAISDQHLNFLLLSDRLVADMFAAGMVSVLKPSLAFDHVSNKLSVSIVLLP